ncbi:MAG: hypothetical protein COB67_11655 [SAR324 cluster bacterium]|uniref:HTH lysR-type domain-containing protein n=1 Tax=SAR324 cluster bacterium TaxID=2024889 RepID=A0A2A4STK4_9DELT|nr:MAG: hypothetical protein COB67_11655 [SAR324 cluster bacterium]
MDNLAEVIVFIRVAEEGSFAEAGKSLNQTAQSIRAQVNTLEKQLGAHLVVSEKDKIRLTDQGIQYFNRCKGIFDDLEEAGKKAQQGDANLTGHLKIAGTDAFFQTHLGDLVSGFLSAHPQVTLDLTQVANMSDLTASGIDVALRIGMEGERSINWVRLIDSRRVICASPAYLKRCGIPLQPQDLDHHECIVFSDRLHLNCWQFKNGKTVREINVSGRMSGNTTHLIKETAIAGFGICRLAYFLIADELNDGQLIEILEDQAVPGNVSIYAAYPFQKRLPLKVQRFVEYLIEYFSKKAHW